MAGIFRGTGLRFEDGNIVAFKDPNGDGNLIVEFHEKGFSVINEPADPPQHRAKASFNAGETTTPITLKVSAELGRTDYLVPIKRNIKI